MTKTEKIFIELLGAGSLGKELNEYIKENITDECLKEVLSLSKRHSVLNVVTFALLKNAALRENDKKAYRSQIMMWAVRHEKMAYELKKISDLFEENEIYHIPLKGAVLRNYYPEPHLRTSCDIDVYIKEEDLEKAESLLKSELGYSLRVRDPHDIGFITKNNISFELHFKLIEALNSKGEQKYRWNADCLKDVWDKAVPEQDKKYCLKMSDEHFYFYHIAHMAKHFEHRGCGARFFVDLWILNHKLSFDKEKRDALLKEGKLKDFEREAVLLSEVWFADAEETPVSRKMESFVLRSGTYGTLDNLVSIQQSKQKGRIKHIANEIFLPYQTLKKNYKILEKHKWMYPFCQFDRWMGLLSSDKREKSTSYKIVKMSAAKSSDETKVTAELFDKLGLSRK